MFKKTIGWATAVAMVLLFGVMAVALTTDEILDRMEAEADTLAEGSMVGTMRFDITYRDGTDSSKVFGMLSKPNYTLIYFIEPVAEAGSIFLTHEIDDGNDSRLWFFLPLLGIPKEMVSDEERGGSFAGSSMSYDDLGGENDRDDFVATLLGEEELVIDDETRTAYIIESVAKEGVDADTPRSVLWVDKEAFLMLKAESYNDLGNLSSTIEVVSLSEFEGMLTFSAMLSTDVLDESSTLITVVERRRPDAEIGDEVFSPDSLTTFDPMAWGFQGDS